MSHRLPPGLHVIERGWLSANNILCRDGDHATLVDSGYVTHAAQTVALVEQALDGAPLSRVINTHSHSDHIGGNAALKARFGCALHIPAGLSEHITAWDETALLLSPLGQQAARFEADQLIHAGESWEMGGLNWQALAVPGHDMEALAFYAPDHRLLIAGDALWENGFGVIFPELLGQAEGLASTRQTLETLARLPIDLIIPGHGSPFTTVDLAFERAFRRLDSFEQSIDRLAWHAIKVIIAFALLEKRSMPEDEFLPWLSQLPFAVDVNQRYLNLTPDEIAQRAKTELLLVNAIRREGGVLLAG